MASNYQSEEVQKKVREKLNKEKIKLWEPPYTNENGEKGDHPQDLIARFSSELSMPEEAIATAIEALRTHSLENFKSKQKFEKSGVATLKIKLAGCVPPQSANLRGQAVPVEIGITVRGYDLKSKISQMTEIDTDRLKLIAAGHVIEDDITLQAQRIKNQSAILALVLTETEAGARRQQEQVLQLRRTREAAQMLAGKMGDESFDDQYQLQIADQTGKSLDLPVEEKQALALAMTLNEKGKSALKRKDYGEALLLLLEADKEFRKCRSDILNAVDNYAILCLDIVWCYLCLKNVNDLPDAENRLKTCEDCFRKSYGPNLERLALVKGGTGLERALYMRLHLLQGILAFHQYRRCEAALLLARAQSELEKLQVSEESMMQVMSMGFSQQEARLGLRTTEGNVQLAVAHIIKCRQERKEQMEKEKEDRKKKKIQRKLGKTANGQEVNIDVYNSLVSMGFAKGAAGEALKQSNNDISLALQVLQDHPELLSLPDPEAEQPRITDDILSQVTGMGFDIEAARCALERFGVNVEKAIEELLRVGGAPPLEWLQEVAAAAAAGAGVATSSRDGGSGSGAGSAEERQREKEMIEWLLPDIRGGEEDHLDLTLEEEAAFLVQYQAMITSAQAPQP